MSYQLLQEPKLYQPAYNDLIHVVTSSNKTQTNFNYIADLYIGTEVFRLKAPAHPTYGSGVFNFGRIIENYVNSDIDNTTFGFQLNSNSYNSYYIKFGEEYGASSGVTSYPNILTSTTKYVWNGVIDFLNFQSYVYQDYSLDGSQYALNTKVATRKVEAGHSAWLYYFANNVTSAKYAKIFTYNASGALEQFFAVLNPYQTSGTIGHHFGRFACGPLDLGNIASVVPGYGMLPITSGTTTSYDISFSDTPNESGSFDSASYNFTIVEADCRYETYRLQFLNKLGAFEGFNFTKKSRKSAEVTKNNYKAPVGSLTSASTFGYSKKDRGDRNFWTSAKDSIKIRTDWITELEYAWLQQLIESPEVFLEDGTHGLIAITITNTSYETKTSINDKLIQLEIDFKYSFDRYSQRY